MNAFPTKITLPTVHGDAEARRLGRDPSGDFKWEINYPWGAETYYGTAKKVRTKMTAAIAQVEAEDTQEAA